MRPDSTKQFLKYALAAGSFVLLASCRLVITTDDTGHIISESGQFDCAQASCAFDIDGPVIDDFTAVPAEGYRFVRWKKLCGVVHSATCTVALAPLPDKLRQNDGDITLTAEFEPLTSRRAWYRDADGDGYGTSGQSLFSAAQPKGFVMWDGDCDDSRDSTHPRAKEKDDGRDNNCDGVTDEGYIDNTFYRDSDRDGFGDPHTSRVSLRKPHGYVPNALDCNDADAADNPDADEVRDLRDNDCDGLVDESDTLFYPDVDGDGFGNGNSPLKAVQAPDGYVAQDGDCDDYNSDINPQAAEQFDGVDNNCDGDIDEGLAVQTWYGDADGDGYGNAADSISAESAPAGYVANSSDNCPGVYNPSQADVDGDGLGDACDSYNSLDPDGDGVYTGSDNCPTVYNPSQSDSDNDGLGNACDSVDNSGTGGGSTGGGSTGGCSPSAQGQEMLNAVNSFRSQTRTCGSSNYPPAPALTWDCRLASAAAGHSQDMAINNYFDHTGLDGSNPGTRATAAGYSWSAVGENIAAGTSTTTVSAAMSQWIGSAGHCANMMNPVYQNMGSGSYSGAGTYNNYWTQVFGKPW